MELQVNGKFVPFSKVKFFQNPFCILSDCHKSDEIYYVLNAFGLDKKKTFCNILEIINRNYHKNYFFGYHDALEIYGALKLCTVM